MIMMFATPTAPTRSATHSNGWATLDPAALGIVERARRPAAVLEGVGPITVPDDVVAWAVVPVPHGPRNAKSD
jgi:hypothetical protein